MKKVIRKFNHLRSINAITIRLSAFALVVWMLFAFSITVAVAEHVYSSFLSHHHSVTFNISNAWHYETFIIPTMRYEDEATVQELLDQHMLNAIMSSNHQWWWRTERWLSPVNRRLRPSVLRGNLPSPSFPNAVIFYDRDGNRLRQSADIARLWYFTEENFGTRRAHPDSDAFIVLGDDTTSEKIREFWSEDNFSFSNPFYHFRLTGYFKNAEFRPVKLSYITREAFFLARNMHGSYVDANRAINHLVRNGWLEWQVLFDNTAEHDGDLVTIFSGSSHMIFHNAGGRVRLQGVVYDNLLDFLCQAGLQDYLRNEQRYSWGFMSHTLSRLNNLREIVIVSSHTFSDGPTPYDQETDRQPEPRLIMLTAISSRPLRYAMSELIYTYIAAFMILAIGVLVLRKIIHRNLTQPLEEVSKGFEIFSDGRNRYRYLNCDDPVWTEPIELIRHYQETTGKLWANTNEITRLNTALDYAKEAEQNRRQMTSNIAHELKTPLAIIHSYSEGLKERIAEEKREQYLDVILAESEHMDSMVLEMLDLSRLEAGKVKLAIDEFSLTELAQSIFDKHKMAANEKELSISYNMAKEYIITADEARIGQVISNFATNAIKYTPHGGNVHVSIYYNSYDKTVFSVENDSKPFSRKELSEIWESFYQADNARTGSGAGLGLAIAKSIIELHGGTCFVRNTKTGVEFGFVI